MTYSTGGPIQAGDYNTFAANMNTIFSDTNTGATTLPTAGYGYGITPVLVSKSAGNTISAIEWATLFGAIKNCGNHQGTAVVPPLPGTAPGYGSGATTLPVSGGTIIAYNSPPGALTTLISTLTTNRFNLLAGQTALTTVGPFSAPSWQTTLIFTFSVNFGSWNNARYFFNSGGSINISGSHPNGAGVNGEWYTMLSQMSPLVFKYNSTTPNVGITGPIGGFWNPGSGNPLTTTYQVIYNSTYGTAPYSGSFINVFAKLGATAGSAGSEVITFQIGMGQLDSGSTPAPSKIGTQFSISEIHSAGAIVYPGPVTITNLGFVAT